MRYKLTLILILFYTVSSALNKTGQTNDFFFWNWYQLDYKISKSDYASFQFQYRLNENASQFNKSNFYFIYGKNLNKKWNAEILYQLTTSYRADNHTFYLGLTYKTKMQQLKINYRSSIQHIRNYFSGDFKEDSPYTEWRNRVRFSYPISNSFSASISFEPYMKFTSNHPLHLSRIRNVAQLSYDLNKYQSVSVFYLYEPEIFDFSTPKNDYVLGLTYQIAIPRKWKKFKNIFELNQVDKKMLKETRDFFL